MIKFQQQPITAGDLNKPIQFFEDAASSGPEVGGGERNILFDCMAEVYESSTKDIDAHSTVAAQNLITVKIRDTYGEYIPRTYHKFAINHYNYPGEYNVISTAPDTRESGFIKIVGEHHGT